MSQAQPPDLSATINTDKRVLELDGVRGLAIVMVLLWHYFYLPLEVVPRTATSYARQFIAWGWSGVDLFFVLSGLLIGGILMRERQAPNFFRVFYVRRSCRILPLYYLVALSYFPVAAWLGSRPEFAKLLAHPFPAWSYATFLQNFAMARADTFGPNWLAVTWSLAIEEQFYLLAPLMVFLLPPRRLPWVLGALVLLAPAVRTFLFFTHHDNWHLAYVLLPGRCDPLAIGMLGAYAMTKPQFVAWLRAHLRELCIALLVSGALLFALQFKFQLQAMPIRTVGHTLFALFFLALIFTALETRLGFFFRNSALRWLGRISYGVYLYHQPVNGLVHGLLRHDRVEITGLATFGATLLSLVLTLIIAQISWRIFEQPILRFGRHFRYAPVG